MAYRHNGFWQCMDTLRDRRQAGGDLGGGQRPLAQLGLSMRVLITGHRGYVGPHVDHSLAEAAGHSCHGGGPRLVRRHGVRHLPRSRFGLDDGHISNLVPDLQ